MKKFKLIKEYPGFYGELGRIAEENEEKSFKYEWKHGRTDKFDLSYFTSYPEFWQEVEEPLFTTEDGIAVSIPNLEVYLVNPTTLAMVIIEAWQWDKTRLVFYYKENAEKYIEQNKPRFSVKDIEDLTRELKSQSFKYWNEIIKQKLGI